MEPKNKKEFAEYLRRFRRNNEDLTQKEVAQFLRECGIRVQYRTYQGWESDNPDISSMPGSARKSKVLLALKHYPEIISLEAPSQEEIDEDIQDYKDESYWRFAADVLLKTGKIAVLAGMAAAVKAFWQPWTIMDIETLDSKPSDSVQKDKTEPMDYASGEAIEKILKRAIASPRHPLSGGFFYHQEEFGLRQILNEKGECNEELIVFVDPVDFTFAAVKGLDGSVLVTFFHRRYGILATVVGDLFRKRIYWRKKGDNPVGFSVKFNQDPMNHLAEEGKGNLELKLHDYIPLMPKRKKKLDQIILNIYTGRPERLLSAANLAKELLQKPNAVSEVFSTGGALGPLRVAEGLWHISLECQKGFRFWDLIPGNFIASYNATVLDLDGNEIDFNTLPNVPFEELNNFRQKFICASTPELAKQTLTLLRLH